MISYSRSSSDRNRKKDGCYSQYNLSSYSFRQPNMLPSYIFCSFSTLDSKALSHDLFAVCDKCSQKMVSGDDRSEGDDRSIDPGFGGTFSPEDQRPHHFFFPFRYDIKIHVIHPEHDLQHESRTCAAGDGYCREHSVSGFRLGGTVGRDRCPDDVWRGNLRSGKRRRTAAGTAGGRRFRCFSRNLRRRYDRRDFRGRLYESRSGQGKIGVPIYVAVAYLLTYRILSGRPFVFVAGDHETDAGSGYSVPVIGTSNKIQGRNTLEKGLQTRSPFLIQNLGGLEDMANLTKYEMETVVNYNAGEQTATVDTRDKSVMRKLDRIVADYPDSYQLLNQTDIDKTYSMPKSFVTYRKPRTGKAENGKVEFCR